MCESSRDLFNKFIKVAILRFLYLLRTGAELQFQSFLKICEASIKINKQHVEEKTFKKKKKDISS